MDDLLNSGMETLGSVLRTDSTTKAAFRSLAGVFEEIARLIREQNKGMVGSLCERSVSGSVACTNGNQLVHFHQAANRS